MTLRELDKVDAIAISPDRKAVTLAIVDDLDRLDSAQHLRALEAKLERYLDFVQSGEFLDKFPQSLGLERRLWIAFRHQPPQAVLDGLAALVPRLQESGFELRWSVAKG